MSSTYQLTEGSSGVLVKGTPGQVLVADSNGLWVPTALPGTTPAPLHAIRFVDASAAAGGNGSISAPFATIADAFADLPIGGIVYLSGGVFTEDVIIPSGLSYALIGLGGGPQKATALVGSVTIKLADSTNVSLQGIELDGLITGVDDGPGVQVCSLTLINCTVAAGISSFGTTHILNLSTYGGGYALDDGVNSSAMVLGPAACRVNGDINLFGSLSSCSLQGKTINPKNSRLIGSNTADVQGSSIGFGSTFSAQTSWHGPLNGNLIFTGPDARFNWTSVDPTVNPAQNIVEAFA